MAEEVKIPEIEKMNMHRLNSDAHFQFNRQNCTLLNKLIDVFKSDEVSTAQITKYGERLAVEDGALKKVIKSALTQKINDADAARDETFRGLLDHNKAQRKHFESNMRDAALRLQIVLDTYGDVSKKAMQEQTSAVHNLCQELLSERYSPYIQRTALTPWVYELLRRNNAFDALVQERYKEDSAKSGVKLKEARAAVDESYHTIIKRIEATMLLQSPEPFLEYVKMHNLAVAKFSVKHQHNHNGNGSPQS